MTLDEFMTWLHEDRNNWARCEPGELLGRLEDAYDQLEALRKYAPRRINTIEELDTLPHNSIVIDRDQQPPEPEPSGTEALIEHGNHDSTPRMLGFTANTPEEYA